MTNQLVDGSHVTWFRVSVVNTHTCGWAAKPSSPASFMISNLEYAVQSQSTTSPFAVVKAMHPSVYSLVEI